MRVIGFAAAYLVCFAIAWYASRWRPKIRPVLPFVFVTGLLGMLFSYFA